MKKILSLVVLSALGFSAKVQAQSTIAAARPLSAGTVVTVRGIVTNGPELGPIRYLQDNVAGIAGYPGSNSTANAVLATLVPGDSVELTGTMAPYNGLVEMNPTSVTILGHNKTVTPVVFTAANALNAFAEAYEGRLVKITGNTSIKTTSGGAVSTFAGNTNYNLNNLSATPLRTNSASTGANGIVGKPAPTGNFDVTGIMSQFAASGTGGYQFLPRVYSDFDLGATPNFTSAPFATNITTTGFTVNFKTQNAGNTKVDYGTSPTALTQSANNATSTTNHSLAISGLSASTLYYVQVTSTNTVGSSVSNVVPMMTASNSTGNMKVYFNRSVNNAYGPASNPAKQLLNIIDDTLVKYVDRATQTIDFTMYSFDNQNLMNLTTALNNAAARGVVVRVITEGSNTNNALVALSPSITKIKRNSSRGIMHNKFIVFDANHTNPNKAIVWTGSTNYTDNQVMTDPNSVIVIQDQSLAKAYRMEFEEMWGNGSGVFGPAKTDNTPHQFNIGGVPVEMYFSPSDNVNSHLIETIATADNDLHIATMLMTRSDIANAIKSQIQAHPGMELRSEMLLDDTVGATGPFMTVKSVLNNRIQKWNQTGIMHHKYLIADVGAPNSDPLAWISSHNWSNGANNDNDENTLVIHNFNIANQYYQEFTGRIDQINKGFTTVNFLVSGLSEDKNAAITTVKVYPNPNTGNFSVSLTDKTINAATLTLTDMAGKTVYSTAVKVNGPELKIETGNLPKGIYSLQLNSNAGTQISKVVIY